MGQESSNALMQQLKERYNLSVDLFTSESSFFFEGAQRQHNLETLRHLSSFGDMVLFLTGDKGAGKTTLLKTLKSSGFEGLNVVYLDVERVANNTQSHSGLLFSECARLLGLIVKDGATSSEVLVALLKECHRVLESDGLRTLFAFDDADKISKKDLQVLLTFCRDLPAESALVMLFAGPSSLLQWSKLGSNLEQSAWCHQIQLKPFSQEDVYDYIVQALASSGSVEKLELSESQLQQLSELGKGLPGRVNKLFPSVILEPGLLKIKPRKKKGAFPVYVLIGLASLLVISFVFVSYQHGILDRMVPVFSLESASESSDEVVPILQNDKTDTLEQERQQSSRLALLDKVLQENGLSLSIDLSASKQSEVVQEGALSNSSDKEVVESNLENSIEVLKEKEIVDRIALNNEKVVEGLNNEAVMKSEASVTLDNEASVVQEKAVEASEFLSLNQPNTHKNFKPKAWLANQPGSAYMAQILGSYQEQTAQKFIKKVGKQKFEIYYLKLSTKISRGMSFFMAYFQRKHMRKMR